MPEPSSGGMTQKEEWARAHPDKMTPDEYNDALRDAREELFSGKQPQSKPVAIILAGQPGSGKSRLTQNAQAELRDKGGAVVIDVDELREFHPRYRELAKEDHETAATRVQPDASQLGKDLRVEAAKGHYNLIIDGTLNNPAKAEQMVRALKEAGYEVDIRAMAVPKVISEQSVAGRLENALADPRGRALPRIVEPSIQEEAHDGLPTALEHVEKLGIADRIEVYERDKADPIYDSKAAHSGQNDASKTLAAARERELTPAQKSDLARNWDRIYQQAEQRNAPQQTLDEYKAGAEKAHLQLRDDPKAAAIYDASATEEQKANSQKLADKARTAPATSETATSSAMPSDTIKTSPPQSTTTVPPPTTQTGAANSGNTGTGTPAQPPEPHAPEAHVTPPEIRAPEIHAPEIHAKGGGVIGAVALGVVTAGAALLNGASPADAAVSGGKTIIDGAVPGASGGFKNLTQPQSFLDRALNWADTATGTVATGAAATAAVTSPLALTGAGAAVPAGAAILAGAAGIANGAVGLISDGLTYAGLTERGGLIHGAVDIAHAYATGVERQVDTSSPHPHSGGKGGISHANQTERPDVPYAGRGRGTMRSILAKHESETTPVADPAKLSGKVTPTPASGVQPASSKAFVVAP